VKRLPAILRNRVSLRVSEVADVIGISQGLVRKLIEKGTLQSTQVETAILIPVSAVLELVGESACGKQPIERLSKDEENLVNKLVGVG